MRLRLKTADSARATLAMVIRKYARGELTEDEARTLRYMLDGLLAWDRFSKETDIDKRVAALEEAMQTRSGPVGIVKRGEE